MTDLDGDKPSIQKARVDEINTWNKLFKFDISDESHHGQMITMSLTLSPWLNHIHQEKDPYYWYWHTSDPVQWRGNSYLDFGCLCTRPKSDFLMIIQGCTWPKPALA